jgi:hypothetical protein
MIKTSVLSHYERIRNVSPNGRDLRSISFHSVITSNPYKNKIFKTVFFLSYTCLTLIRNSNSKRKGVGVLGKSPFSRANLTVRDLKFHCMSET